MANGISNPFAPMNQAWQGLNQAIVKASQIRRQRRQQNLQNQLTQAKLYNEMQDVRQKRGLQNYMRQQQQQARGQEAQRISNLLPSTEQRQNLLQQAVVTPEAMGGGMQGLQQGQQLQNQMTGAAMQEAQTPPDFNSRRAQLEYLQQTDPQKAAEELQSELKSTLKLADYDPDAAEQRWQNLTGHRLNIQQGEGGKYIESARGTMFVPENEPTKAQLVTGPGGEPVQKGKKDMSAKEEEIQRYLQEGIADTRDQATKLAYDQYKLGQDRFGRSAIIDVTTGEVIKPLGGGEDQQQQQTGQQRQQQQRRKPFISVEEAAEGVGPVSSIKQMMNNIIGPFTPGQLFEDTEQARNKLRIFRQRIKPYLMVSSRGAVYEQQNIEKFLPNPDQFFTDPDATKDQLQNLYSMINATIEKKQELIDQGDITADQMQIFNQDIKKLQTALSYMPDEEVLFEPKTDQQQMSKNIQDMSNEELQALNPENLSNQELDALEQRLNEIEGNQ